MILLLYFCGEIGPKLNIIMRPNKKIGMVPITFLKNSDPVCGYVSIVKGLRTTFRFL